MVIDIFLTVLVISLFFKFNILRYYGHIPRYGVLTKFDVQPRVSTFTVYVVCNTVSTLQTHGSDINL